MNAPDLALPTRPLCACGRPAEPRRDLCRKCLGRARWIRRRTGRKNRRPESDDA